MTRTKVRQIVKALGGPEFVASQLINPKTGKRLTRAAVSKWPRVPSEHAVAVARMSGGRYRPEDLRPDFPWPKAA